MLVSSADNQAADREWPGPAERARADYHRAIRRLHAAGGSLREIADALGLSHQRVHQIIDEATEPTRPRWRRRPQRRPGPPGPCSFCGRSREERAKLIAGPGVFICDRCLAQATGLSAGAVVEGRAVGPMRGDPGRDLIALGRAGEGELAGTTAGGLAASCRAAGQACGLGVLR